MASYSHLRKLAAMERENALAVLDALLPDDPDAREALLAARRDVIGKNLPKTLIHASAWKRNSPKFAKKGSKITHLGDAPGSDAR